MSLLLFDIDGTLLLSGGAGARAMTRVFAELLQVRLTFTASDVAGRTDRYIVSAGLNRAGIEDTLEMHRRVREAYVSILREEIVKPPIGPSGLMPGIEALLASLHALDSVHCALLTGNFEAAAHVKLGHYGIDRYFAWGVFGDDSTERSDLARAAVRRAEARGVPSEVRERPVVVGDTPHDVACARAIGARVIAVATGTYSMADLRDAGADFTLPDLSDTEQVLKTITRPVF